MASHLSFKGVQQSLSARHIRFARAKPYEDGRSRYEVWPQGRPRALAEHTDDIDTAYIVGLKMASAREAAHAAR